MVVVDANVLAYLFLTGDRTEQAQALFAKDCDWRSDAFILVEFTNVLTTSMRARRLPESDAAALLSTAESMLRDRLQFVSHADALRVAARFGVSAYDARYLAVCQVLGRKLVTEDGKLRAAAPSLTMSISESLLE